MLYVLEDAHWIDPTTQKVVTRTLGVIAEAQIMMLITYRPDLQTEWARHPQVTALTLSRLSRRQGTAIVFASGGNALPDDGIQAHSPSHAGSNVPESMILFTSSRNRWELVVLSNRKSTRCSMRNS